MEKVLIRLLIDPDVGMKKTEEIKKETEKFLDEIVRRIIDSP